MGALLDVDPAAYDAASAVLGRRIGEPLADELTRLCDALAGTHAMAGSDPAGAAWGRAYDEAVATALTASQDVVTGCFRLAALLQQTGFNYGRAESASTPGRVSTTPPDRTHYEHRAAVSECVPSSAGGSGSAPSGWSIVAHAVGYVWPDGHQDRLRDAGRAWTWSASAVRDAAYAVTAAIEAVGGQRAPEVGDALVACEAMRRHLDELASAHDALAKGCQSYAGHLDEAHSAMERELADLVAWTAGIEGSGLVFAIVSAGISEAAAQAAEAARIAAAAARVMAIIRRLVELAGVVTEAISNVVTRVLRISGDLRTLLATRVLAVVTEEAGELPALAKTARTAKTAEAVAEERLAAVARGLPSLSIERAQIEKKFKHARDFGVIEGRGARAYDRFANEVAKFVENPNTVRVRGTYRGNPALLNYDPDTMLVVVQSPDGAFVSAWRMSAGQLQHAIERRSLGGG